MTLPSMTASFHVQGAVSCTFRLYGSAFSQLGDRGHIEAGSVPESSRPKLRNKKILCNFYAKILCRQQQCLSTQRIVTSPKPFTKYTCSILFPTGGDGGHIDQIVLVMWTPTFRFVSESMLCFHSIDKGGPLLSTQY